MKMASQNHHLLLFLLLLAAVFTNVLSFDVVTKTSLVYPFSCSDQIQTCNSYLYHISEGLTIDQIASFYSVNTSNIKPLTILKQDYLVSVPCTCKDVNGTQGYFYDTPYRVQSGDTFMNITRMLYSGQAWKVENEEELFVAGDMITIHLLCGCIQAESQEIVTYTVQENDTLSGIAELLTAKLSGIQGLNERLTQNPGYIDVGWVLFIPKEKNGIRAQKQGKRNHLTIILAILSAATLCSLCTLILFLIKGIRNHKNREENLKSVNKCRSPSRISSQSQFRKTDIEGVTFESERPVVYSVDEIDKATSNFDISMKIGQGGYGSVYLGFLKERSKEFYAELKVLCKIHHINVVELLGYASGDNHLYLVYEYIQNGSLSDHLHDPLLKGHTPLSWTARAQIAVDAARGIEYIHDHTKAQYVHRDIKTSNILLDQGLRAKVSDFGLAKLLERSSEEEFMATRLVGTPGYIAPESVRELQMNSKTDVFAFGVVLAELITGQRALMLTIFMNEDIETVLEANIDANLRGSYPMEEVCEMAEISRRCLSEDPLNRPEMREIVQALSQILTASIEWEASLGGSSLDLTGVFVGR
ncbi:hypothetical protein GH714_040667 [Hevea brasiliensis]|uniref:Protein kinase domain-containing protein n=1 Tax=Hevea brasiliensis TaxID=3981 RepID=A0A6A6KW96_HEVBR|nr:hypothetical protein GH714_040667 [Hevea brasiliensis]